ncbi:integrase [Sorangium sp. So ce315]|uniref:integrase n=1 Tax=Sorangium sp. So ce315 TaxID=3133299 RepID=UPI003F607B72
MRDGADVCPAEADRHGDERENPFDTADLPHNTRRLYVAQWRQFTAWCAGRHAVALPARPRHVALYLAFLARERLAPSTLRAAIQAIAKAHQITGYASPAGDPIVVRAKRRILAQISGERRHVVPLGPAQLHRIVRAMHQELADLRDRALLLVGYAAMLRRTELVALDVEDALMVGGAIELSVRGRRVEVPNGQHDELCPVRALAAWVDAAALRTGPLFRSINRWARLGGRLCDRSVSEIVQSRARQAGLDTKGLSGDSLHLGSADDRRFL